MKSLLLSLLAFLSFTTNLLAQELVLDDEFEDDFLEETSVSAPETEENKEFNYEPKPLDGVLIEALETYKNPKSHAVGFGLGVFPIDPYFNGFAISGSYTYYFSKTYAWEVVNANYVFPVQGSLTTELADNFGVNPELIEKTNFTLSTNLHYVHSYGKLVFLEDYIKYFRSGLIGGLGMVGTSEGTESNILLALSLGVRFELFVNETFSVKFDIRDLMTFSGGVENYLSFNVGTGISF